MKHVFWVHSHITFLITKSIIESRKLDNNVILLSRNYSIPNVVDAQVFSFPYYYNPNSKENLLIDHFSVLASLKNIRACMTFIESIIGNHSYHLYIPIFNNPPIRCLIEYEKCEKFYYIEEGYASYRSLNELDPKENIFLRCVKRMYRSLLPYRHLLGGKLYDYKHEKFDGTYSFFEDAFKWNKTNKYLVNLKKSEKILSKIDADSFLFFDALVEFGRVSEHVFFRVLNDVLDHFCKNGVRKLAYKFHPQQLNNELMCNQIRAIMSNYSNEITFIELDRDFIAEYYFLQYNVKVYIFISSIGFYAVKNKMEVYSLLSFFKKHDHYFYEMYKDKFENDFLLRCCDV